MGGWLGRWGGGGYLSLQNEHNHHNSDKNISKIHHGSSGKSLYTPLTHRGARYACAPQMHQVSSLGCNNRLRGALKSQ